MGQSWKILLESEICPVRLTLGTRLIIIFSQNDYSDVFCKVLIVPPQETCSVRSYNPSKLGAIRLERCCWSDLGFTHKYNANRPLTISLPQFCALHKTADYYCFYLTSLYRTPYKHGNILGNGRCSVAPDKRHCKQWTSLLFLDFCLIPLSKTCFFVVPAKNL